MNQYQIYQAIGKGKHSNVYKGRKKKTIEYYGIKRVEKSQKNKVLQEVKILHSLDHPNVLKFYSWHETAAHIWLVLEYCVGGDLRCLLKQDSHLPEESIHDLAMDLVRALQYLHSKGIIYCNLKPSNILLDENGHIKLCDFGLARRISEISETSTSLLPQAKRGTPCYMAPELFQDVGVHSYASDFWSLGCVLFECYTGRPPFEGNEFTRLANSIISDPTPPIPGDPSNLFVDLVNCLLIKNPADRVKWPELCKHGFWKTKLASAHLPPEPAFSNMLVILAKSCYSGKNSDKPPQQNSSKPSEREVNVLQKFDENCNTPKRFESAGKIQARTTNKTIEEKPRNISKGINLLRLSKIAKANLQRENEKDNYRRALSKNDNDVEVQIENNDMELNFSENVEEDGHDELESDAPKTANDSEIPYNIQLGDNVVEAERDEQQHNAHETPEDESSTPVQAPYLDNAEVTSTPPSSVLKKRTPRVITGLGATHGNSSDNLLHIMWHSSDLSVRPIMPVRKFDKISGALHFDIIPVCEFVKLSPGKMESLVNRIVLALSGNTSVSEKQNTIKYLEMLSGNTDAANILMNGPLMPLLVKMLRQSKASTLHVQLALVMGLLIRHATFIQVDLASSGLMNALADRLRDRDEKLRRFAMAALGELLFYISAQSESSDREINTAESPSKETRGWQVPSSVIALVSSMLRKGEDDTTQLYALKTIENICSQGADWAARFTNRDVVTNLYYIYKAIGKQDSTRLAAGSCLVRLARFTLSTIQSIMEKLSLKDAASLLLKGGHRECQVSLNLLNLAMLGMHLIPNISRQLLSLMEEKNLVPTIISLTEHENEVLRGKTLVFIALLCKSSRRWLPLFFCNARLLSAVDKLTKEKEGYVKTCMDAFVSTVVDIVPELLKTVSADVKQMMGGRIHGHLSMLSGRANPKANFHFIPVIHHLLDSLSFKHMVVCSPVLQQLSNLIKLLESPFQGRDDFLIAILRILESITEEASFLFEEPCIFIASILPSLSVLYKGNKDGNARFLCLKILFDAMVIFLNEVSDSSGSDIINGLKSLSYAHVIPLYPVLIEDEDPIPVYAQKLLVMLIEFKFVKTTDILHPQTVSHCFEFLLGDLSNSNVNNVKLCLLLASAPEMEAAILSKLHVVRKLGNFLEFVKAKEMDEFVDSTLCLCKAFILKSIGSTKVSSYLENPSLLSTSAVIADFQLIQHNFIEDISDFSDNVSVFLELNKAEKTEIADLASECLFLLLNAAPREGAMALLINLSEAASVLDLWCHGLSKLLVLRLLYGISYSCRLCLSQNMIIALPETIKLEAVLSSMRESYVPGIQDAAAEVALYVQRLHHGN